MEGPSSASVVFTALSGAGPNGAAEPACYLLEIDECCLLLDCGSEPHFDAAALTERLRDVAPRVDAVVLSHADVGHLGALPFAMARLGLDAPVYATLPVCKMGQMFLYEAHRAAEDAGRPPPFSLDDVDRAFERFVELKYSQQVRLSGRGAAISLLPLAAGHSIGGALWRISKGVEEVLYVGKFNLSRERHLEGAVFDALPRRAVLLLNARNGLAAPSPRKARERALLDAIGSALARGADVVMPVDTAGRLLEVLLVLEQSWRADRRLARWPVVLLSGVGQSTLEFAKSQIEWMSKDVVSAFELNGENSFAMRHVRVCADMASCLEVPGPKLVLASAADLDGGFAAELLPKVLAHPRALLLLTQRSPAHTLAGKLAATPTPTTARVRVRERVPLAGAELEAFDERRRRAAPAGADTEDPEADPMDVEPDEEPPDADEAGAEVEAEAEAASAQTGDGKRRRHLMLPYAELGAPKRSEWGELLTPAEWEAIAAGGGWRSVGAEALPAPTLMGDKPARAIEGAGGADDELLLTGGAAGDAEADDEGDGEEEEEPYKWVEREEEIPVRCAVQYVDMEGLCDGRSLKMVVSQLAPLKVILVGADEAATRHLSRHVGNNAAPSASVSVVTPGAGGVVFASSESAMYRLRLSETLLAGLKPVRLGAYSVARASGRVRVAPTASAAPDGDGAREGDEGAPGADGAGGAPAGEHAPSAARKGLAGTLEAAPADAAQGDLSFISHGELRLTELKQMLMRSGERVELSDGVLRLGTAVRVRKSAAHTLVLEGAYGPQYLQARKLMASMGHFL